MVYETKVALWLAGLLMIGGLSLAYLLFWAWNCIYARGFRAGRSKGMETVFEWVREAQLAQAARRLSKPQISICCDVSVVTGALNKASAAVDAFSANLKAAEQREVRP